MSISLPFSRSVMGPTYVQSNWAGNSTGTAILESQDIRGVRTFRVGWKKLRQPARGTPLPYNMEWVSARNCVIYTSNEEYLLVNYADYFNYKYTRGIDVHSPVLNSDPNRFYSDANYRAKVKLFDSLKGEGANIANSFGERKQIINSVVNLLGTIVGTVRDLRRGNVASAIRRMGGDPWTARKLKKQDIANQWLSLQYGWKPLLSDVYELITLSHRRNLAPIPVVIRASGYVKASELSPGTISDATGKVVPWGTCTHRMVNKYMIRVIPDSRFAEPAALGLTNPLGVLWEITPWSFVVDWFLPVGRYLDQLCSTHGWTFYDGCESTLYNYVEKADHTSQNESTNYGAPGYQQTYKNSTSCKGYWTYARMTRATLSSFPTVDIPQFKNPLSIAHFENSLALLSQLMSKK